MRAAQAALLAGTGGVARFVLRSPHNKSHSRLSGLRTAEPPPRGVSLRSLPKVATSTQHRVVASQQRARADGQRRDALCSCDEATNMYAQLGVAKRGARARARREYDEATHMYAKRGAAARREYVRPAPAACAPGGRRLALLGYATADSSSWLSSGPRDANEMRGPSPAVARCHQNRGQPAARRAAKLVAVLLLATLTLGVARRVV